MGLIDHKKKSKKQLITAEQLLLQPRVSQPSVISLFLSCLTFHFLYLHPTYVCQHGQHASNHFSILPFKLVLLLELPVFLDIRLQIPPASTSHNYYSALLCFCQPLSPSALSFEVMSSLALSDNLPAFFKSLDSLLHPTQHLKLTQYTCFIDEFITIIIIFN